LTEETRRILSAIEERGHSVNSFVVQFASHTESVKGSTDSTGRIWFKKPDSYRTEMENGGNKLITVQIGTKVSTYSVTKELIYVFDLSKTGTPREYSSISFPRLNDLIGAIDRESLVYLGQETLAGTDVYSFTGKIERAFDTFGKATSFTIEVRMKVGVVSGLMLEYETKTDSLGLSLSTKASFTIRSINEPIEESLFRIEAEGKSVRYAEITQMMHDAFNPHDGHVGASNN
jgi:outer membrane lipoprotein-sorting protein